MKVLGHPGHCNSRCCILNNRTRFSVWCLKLCVSALLVVKLRANACQSSFLTEKSSELKQTQSTEALKTDLRQHTTTDIGRSHTDIPPPAVGKLHSSFSSLLTFCDCLMISQRGEEVNKFTWGVQFSLDGELHHQCSGDSLYFIYFLVKADCTKLGSGHISDTGFQIQGSVSLQTVAATAFRLQGRDILFIVHFDHTENFMTTRLNVISVSFV